MRPNSNLYDLVDLHLKIQKLRVGRELRFIHLVGLNEYNQMKKDLPSKQKLRKATPSLAMVKKCKRLWRRKYHEAYWPYRENERKKRDNQKRV